MSKLTKNRKTALAKVETGKVYKLGEAAALLKEITFTKFDASVDLDVRLGVDPRKSNQMVRGVVTLPHGTGKQVRVLVLCTPDKENEAKEAGADYVGLDEYIEKIKGRLDRCGRHYHDPQRNGQGRSARTHSGSARSDAEPQNRHGYHGSGQS